MKKLIILITMIFMVTPVLADKYSKDYKEKIAKVRAAQHPKGSGIGTNKYTTGRYDKVTYPIDKYIRKD